MVFTLSRIFSMTAVLAVVISVLLADAAMNSAAAQEDRKWIEASSANFRVRSMLSEKKTVELLRELEVFRASALLVTGFKSDASLVPTEIYIVRGSDEMRQFGLSSTIAGLFMPGLRENLILMKETRGISETHVIQHEYVHFLMQNRNQLQYPKWYSEGFAEYLGSSVLDRGKFKVGIAPRARADSLRYLNWISIKDILDPVNSREWTPEETAMFYTQSWAMVHFLQTDPEYQTRFRVSMMNYINDLSQGGDPIKSFERAFEVDAETFGLKVKRYVQKDRFSYGILEPDELLPDFSPTVNKMSREQASMALANIAMSFGKPDLAQNWYSIANEDKELQAYAEAGLGRVFLFDSEFEKAWPHFEKAINIEPEDPLLQLDIAKYFHILSQELNDPNALQKSRDHYLKAWQLNNTLPETYFMYGHTYLDEGKDIAKGIEMLEQAKLLAGASPTILVSLMNAYASVDRNDEAVSLARTILSVSHAETGWAKRAREIIDQIEGKAMFDSTPEVSAETSY